MEAIESLHPSDQVLSDYGLGKLDEAAAVEVNDHLEGCVDCRRRVAGLSSDSFLGRLREARKPSARSILGESLDPGTLSLMQGRMASPPPSADSLPPGLAEHLDYEIKRELGRGGMGVVYLAHNTMMGRDEVLKVMGRGIMDRPHVLERFQREIRAVARLRHVNIVAAYSAFRIEGGLVFAMEYVEGVDLARLVKAKGPLPILHASYFIHQAALGLQHAHDRGMIHRDIKPHNLMLTHDGKARIVKVLDFGLAKATREEKAEVGLTSEGQALGTPDYIAPEQIVNALDVDIRADIYSLGGTLFFLLAGRPPFQANSLYDMYQAHMSRDVDPLNLLRPEVPSELAAIVSKMMAKDPARRFQSPAEVAEALKPFFKGATARAKPEISRSELSIPPSPPPVLSEPDPKSAVPAPEAPAPEANPPKESEPAAVESPGRRPPWRKTSLAAGFLAFGVVALIAGIVRVKTSRGDLVFADLPDQAVVTVDGQAATLDWSAGKDSAKVSVASGGHKVQVVWKGVEIVGEEVKIGSGEAKPIRIWLEPGGGDVPSAPDLVKPGTVWTSEDEVRTLTILDRDGEYFSAILTDSDKLRRVRGTIKGTKMVMLGRDMTILVGPAGVDHEAEVKGDEITDNWVLGDGNTGQWTFRLKKKPEAANMGVDAFRSGSVWFVRDTGTTLTVLDRDGGHFRAITAEPSRVREIAGTIDGGRISWRGADVKVLFGPPAADFDGEIRGDSISLAWHLPDGTVGGRSEALLKRPAGQLVQAGSVWEQEGFAGLMTILERAGEQFKAMYVGGDHVREYNGTIRGIGSPGSPETSR